MATSTTNTTHTPVLHTDLPGALRAVAADWRARWAAYRTYRRTRDELSGLSDRDLADLGLNRSMIEGVAREAAGYAN